MHKILLITFLLTTNAFASLNIVVSIKPLHSIVSNLTQGITTPKLLLEKNQSAHHSHLQPSQLSMITHANLIISMHPEFEAGLAKALSNIDKDKQIVVNDDVTEHRHSWLNVSSMEKLSVVIAKKLMKIDTNNKVIYQKNLQRLQKKLAQLKIQNQKALSVYKNQDVATFSTALTPFLKSNGLKNSIVVTSGHNDRLSIYKIRNARKAMKKQQTACLLNTIEIPNKHIKTLTESLTINTRSIDVIGFGIAHNIQQYFQLMRVISNQVVQCLK